MPSETSSAFLAPSRGAADFPAGLLDWAGNRGGGVRRLFDDHSGRPGGAVIETNLLNRLREWADSFASENGHVPRIVILVGGPGNGKTEAVEATIRQLDIALRCGERLIGALSAAYHPADGNAVPRRVSVEAGKLAAMSRTLRLDVVQDASVGSGGQSPAKLLVAELNGVQSDAGDTIYLCCVNRGVLDDALIYAIDNELAGSKTLLESIVQAVSLAPDALPCWPLEGHPTVAVWPMDAESLIEPVEGGSDVPAASILHRALDPNRWFEPGVCSAGPACPFCTSRKALSGRRELDALLRMLRWFELGSGKRWAFRDLFSLASYLLAGSGTGKRGAAIDPCGWAAALLEADKRAELGGKPTKESSAAIYWLVAAQYQHALFHRWDNGSAGSLYQNIKELGLRDDNTAMGLYYFLQSRASGYVPAMFAPLLDNFVELLDPALSSPDAGVGLWGAGAEIKLREFDARFSRSVQEGLDFAVTHRALSQIERTLLSRLAQLDERLSLPSVRRKRPTAASRIQRFVRDFASRIFRRSVGARQAVVPDLPTLEAFQKVVADADGRGHDLREIAHQVEDLLNHGDHFEVSLTTTFGQPLPPERGRAMLVVPRRSVLPRDVEHQGRPRPALCFLDVGLGSSFQPIALTYELFKAVKDLDSGLSQASLPRSVLALLDTTRARMAGSIVRDRSVQERPNIVLGGSIVIGRQRGHFVSTKRGGWQ